MHELLEPKRASQAERQGHRQTKRSGKRPGYPQPAGFRRQESREPVGTSARQFPERTISKSTRRPVRYGDCRRKADTR